MKRGFQILLVTTFISLVGLSHTKEKETDSSIFQGPYLGQKPPGMAPEIFAPGIVSVDKYSEFVCMFTPGAEECIFDRYGDDEYQSGAVFVTRIKNGKWTEPEIFTVLEKYDDVFLPTLSPDGKYWFFTSKNLPVPEGTKKIIPMYFIEKNETGWTGPEYLTQSIHASMTLDGIVYVNSGRKIKSNPKLKTIVDLYGSLPFETGHPVISPDGSYLVFDNRKLAGQNDCKLFVSFKKGDFWTDPISLNKFIKQHAFCAWITFDGKYIFFHSLDSAKGNIYWISAEIIEELKSELE